MRARMLLVAGSLASASLLASAPLPAVAAPMSAACQALAGWGFPQPPLKQTSWFPKGAALYGVVRTLDGSPVAHAVVTIKPRSKGGKGGRTVTDAKGRYSFSNLVPEVAELSVAHRGMRTVGPLSVRIVDNGKGQALPLEVNIGGMGLEIPVFSSERSGGSLSSRLLKLPGLTRDLVPDGSGGVAALEMKRLDRLTESGARPDLRFGTIERGLSWAPGRSRLYSISGFGSDGTLSGFSPAGEKVLCRTLPFEPTDVAAGPDDTAWVVGAQNAFGIAVVVDRNGTVRHEVGLSPGSSLRVAVDRAGDGWLIDRHGALIRMTPTGKVVASLYLPQRPELVLPTRDGGVWAVGGTTAVRLDARQRPVAEIVRPRPIELATLDSADRLWFLEASKLTMATPHGVRAYELRGMPIDGAAAMALDDARHLWLLGLDRLRVAVAKVP